MKKYWFAFGCTQLLGISSGIYSMSLQVGVGGVREFLWIVPAVLLFPGVFLAVAAGGLDVSVWLGRWYSIPLFMLIVGANAASWAGVAYIVGRKRARRGA